MSLSFRKLVFAFSLSLLSAGSANATLIGDTVNVAFFSSTFGPNNVSVVVGAGQETSFYGNFGIDIGDNYVKITLLNGPFCGFTCNNDPATLSITDMDFNPLDSISSVSLIDGGMQPFNASFTADSVTFQMPDIAQNTGYYAQLYFNTTQAAVPEPANFALLSFGLAALGFSRRKIKA